jgi:hypothetical protein
MAAIAATGFVAAGVSTCDDTNNPDLQRFAVKMTLPTTG